MIVILFVICLLPGQIAWLLLDFVGGGEKESEITQTIFKFADILNILHLCLNPIVYGLSNKHFQRECIQHFFDCFTCGWK